MKYTCHTHDIQMTYEWYTHDIHMLCTLANAIKYKRYNMSIEHWLLLLSWKFQNGSVCASTSTAVATASSQKAWVTWMCLGALGAWKRRHVLQQPWLCSRVSVPIGIYNFVCARTDSWNFSFARERVGPKETKPLLVVSKAVRERKKHNMIEGS